VALNKSKLTVFICGHTIHNEIDYSTTICRKVSTRIFKTSCNVARYHFLWLHVV